MLVRRRFLATALAGYFLIVTGILGTPATASAQSIESQAKTFIGNLSEKVINALTAPGRSEQQRSTNFHQLLNENFAIKTIGRWVLGRHWKKATKAEQTEYLSLFEELLVVTYVNRFSSYSGETLKIDKTVPNGKDNVTVFSRIIRDSSQPPLHVDWRVRSRKNSLKIVDVVVEGVSMGLTQRAEFASVIRQNGGKMEGLLDVLRKRTGNDA